MNKEILRSYWKNPQSVDLAHLKELNKLCEEYPYAVGLKQLYCKALIVHQDLNFEKVLKSTAIQTAQRGTLRSWLLNDLQSNDKYLYPIISSEIEEEEEDFSEISIEKTTEKQSDKDENSIKTVENIAKEKNETVVEEVDNTSVIVDVIDEISEKKENIHDFKAAKNNLSEPNPEKLEIHHNEVNNEVNWNDIKPIKITLLPVPTVIQKQDESNENRVDLNSNEQKIEEEDVLFTNEKNEDNLELIDEKNHDYTDKLPETYQPQDELDKQIINAAILGSEYHISESDNLPEKPIKKNKTSFLDWFDRIEKGDLNDEEFAFRKKAEKIIDQFLANQPKIKIKKEFYSAENYVKKGSEENDDIISETLIKIYIQQGHIQKAIDGYQKLAIKFPEKSNYFQSEIEKIK